MSPAELYTVSTTSRNVDGAKPVVNNGRRRCGISLNHRCLRHLRPEGTDMKNIHRVTLTTIACLLACLPRLVSADVKLSPLFSDHMVLQQGAQVPVWGTADANEQVTVTIADKKATASADAAGKWIARVGPLAAGGPVEVAIAGKNNNVTIKDV